MEQSAYPVQKENAPGAVPSLVLGIISMVFTFTSIISIVLGIIAIVLGVKAKKNIKTEPTRYEGDGLAIAGIVLGAIGIAGAVIFTIWIITAIVAASYWL
ncbi:DUF4190 domain-containing protein [candidate division WOR-3 bacterium]|uniref:DUF4190 domain-containing protein n=1 Tax=candidate division WOR-3 bacterium TaxID=2052148 RepID=A0A9D5QCP7_UNCW3|nr:DUF4190 domain-containing protein [candidate division WOR-3 bacterium]MBD3364784.1 DUF4190 domain-containing protein [candidate division WOR-3 bacterium]